MTPQVICLMSSSLDGRLHPSRYTASPDGDTAIWTKAFETLHDELAGDAWLVGRATMAEMTKAEAHVPANPGAAERPMHVATRADSYAVALDPSGKLHFDGPTIGGDHVIVLLGADVTDGHLAELAADGVSYIVANGPTIDIRATLLTLGEAFGVKRLLLEGGATINGTFFAAGVVEAFHVLVTPALDGQSGVPAIVEHDEGLAGKIRLAFAGADVLDHGIVHLRYTVSPA